MMMAELEAKFHVGRELPFAFIDSWAKHPANIDDLSQVKINQFCLLAKLLFDVSIDNVIIWEM